MVSPVENEEDVTTRAACVETIIEAEAFAMAVMVDKVCSPITAIRRIEDGYYGGYCGEVLVGYCRIECTD